MKKVILKGIPLIAFVALLSTISCSNDDTRLDAPNASSTLDSEFHAKTASKLVTRTNVIDMVAGCWKIQVQILEVSSDGTERLLHLSTIQTGPGCEPDQNVVIGSITFGTKAVPITVIRDDKPTGGSISDFYTANPNEVKNLVVSINDTLGL